MRVLIAAIHYPAASGRYLADAFRRGGHDVRTAGFMPGTIWGIEYDPRWQWRETGGLTHHWPDWTPDLVVVSESAWAYHHPHYPDVPHVVFGADNHVRDYRQARIERYFLAHKAVTIQPFDETCEWLPGAYDPAHFRPSPIPYVEREYDVAIIGVPYPRREEMVAALLKAGVSVYPTAGLFYDDYAAAYHQARMSLCVSAAGDVAQRIFETAVMGCLVLTDPLADLEALDPQGLEVYENKADLVKIVKYYLKNADLAEEQIAKSIKWALPYTWDARCKAIEVWYNKAYKVKTKRGKKTDGNGPDPARD